MGPQDSGAALSGYRARISVLEVLEPEVERALANAFRQGDQGAGRRLITANLRHVIRVAQQYRRWGVPLDDLVQQGNIGLLKAAQHYDPKRETSLATYASYWIKAEIRDYVMRSYRIVRLGTTRTERRALRAYRTSSVQTVEELVRLSGMPEARCKQLWPLLARGDRSLDAVLPSGTKGSDLLRSDLPDPEQLALQQETEQADRARVAHALGHLTERERRIVWARLAQDAPETLSHIGKRLGVSKERVRQLEQRATQKLREALAISTFPLRSVQERARPQEKTAA